MRKGFTLIELLIVVAIIAILAAIAVPNFLEAQVRSKVSRVKADLRSLATAIESYYVDNNSYPSVDSSTPGASSGFGVNNQPTATVTLKLMPTFRRKNSTATITDNLSTLTTPIAYITSIFGDPFAKTKGASFSYSTPSVNLSLELQNSAWITWSFGPDTDEAQAAPNPGDIALVNYSAEGTRILDTWYNPAFTVPSDLLINATYDPTNGTTSNGDVYRIKQ